MKYFYFLILLLSFNIHAEENSCITFKKDYGEQNDDKNYDLITYITDCKNKFKKLDTYGYFGDSPKINFYFFQKIGALNRLFVSTYVYTDIYEEKPKYVYKEGKYNFTYVYDCENLNCKKNEKISNFFGNGGSLVETKFNKTVSNFPYESNKNIQNEIKTDFFKKWYSNQLKNGTVKNKLYIYENAGLNSDKLGYLVVGDKFKIKDISSRWLNIVYTNSKGVTTTGWIQCKDTNVCN